MKKFLVVAIMAIMGLGAIAQDWYAGGQVGFWRNSSENETSFSVLPEIGFNLNEKLAVGTVIGYDYNYIDGFKRNLVVFKPYARYTLFQNDSLSLFADGGVDLGFGNSKMKGEKASDTAVTYGVGIKPGLAYKVASDFSLVAHVGFFGYEGGNNASRAADQGGLKLNLNQVEFGFYYHF